MEPVVVPATREPGVDRVGDLELGVEEMQARRAKAQNRAGADIAAVTDITAVSRPK